MQLSHESNELWRAAVQAQRHAYAPYSNFAVGAAIRGADGVIYSGCNVENAAYPEGTCAEAGAICAMVRAGVQEITEIAVVGDGEELCTPCGGCRQKIREFASSDTEVIIGNAEKVKAKFSLAELLPASFGPDHLG